jgi:hypothetical protein
MTCELVDAIVTTATAPGLTANPFKKVIVLAASIVSVLLPENVIVFTVVLAVKSGAFVVPEGMNTLSLVPGALVAVVVVVPL